MPGPGRELFGKRPQGHQEVGRDGDRRLGGVRIRSRPGREAERKDRPDDESGQAPPPSRPNRGSRHQALALGRALTASCQRRTFSHPSGVSTLSRLMKSTATSAVMSATV